MTIATIEPTITDHEAAQIGRANATSAAPRRTGLRADQTRARVSPVSVAGVAKVRGEWALVCTSHNILKLYRLCA